MEFRILNKDLLDVDILDTYESMIWTDRYSRCGDFEFYIPANRQTLGLLIEDYYIWHRDSEHVMIIEDRMIDTNVEEGNFLTVTGRSLESILGRRIIWQQTVLTGNLQNGIQKLLNENIISPTDPNRKIDNFIFEPSTDPNVTSLTVNTQFTGDNLYDAVVSLCETNGIGFKVTLSDDNKFVFKLYAGQDRSYDQIHNPYVVFSPGFDNLLNTNYVESKKNLKTVTLVAGEGEGLERRTTTVGGGTALDRRELYTDARDLRSDTSEGELTEAEYLAQLEERGIEKLSEYQTSQTFDGQTENLIMFKYGVDYFMGDIIQLENEYGITSRSRVTELIRSHNNEGVNIYPTFTNLNDFEFSTSGVLTPGTPRPGMSGSEILAKLKTVDGAGSGLDSDLLDGRHANEFMTRINLSFQVQKTAYRHSVIALCELTNSVNPSLDSYSNGKVLFHRNNELSGAPSITAILGIGKRYNTTQPQGHLLVIGSELTGKPRFCTFTYNGIKYGGIEFYYTAAEHGTVIFEGYTNFNIFGLDYLSDSPANTILVEDVYNSLSFTDHFYVGNMYLNEIQIS